MDRWFAERYGAATEPQRLGWPAIRRGDDTLIAAPTGSGKTLAAFLVCIDRLLRDGLAGNLKETTRVLYISPLKALSHDVRINLTSPLAELNECAEKEGACMPQLRVMVRTGDTPANERAQMVRKPPHILVTTPESLFLLLAGKKSRNILRSVDTVIVDEIHALARDKRGSHLTLSLERLALLTKKPPQRIGLSATQKPLEAVAQFLVGTTAVNDDGTPRCTIVNQGHRRALDLDVAVPPSELSAVCSNEQWLEVYAELEKLVNAHRSTLIFVNTRKMAERLAHHLSQTLGEGSVASHHGSLARETRLAAEKKLKAGELKAIVATASLELGIDVGFVDLVVQIGSPRSISTFLQRIGRSGHALNATPKGRLFALTRDELLEALALLTAVKNGELDKIVIPQKPLDILAQHLVAAAAAGRADNQSVAATPEENEQDDGLLEDDLFAMATAAHPFRDLTRKEFNDVLAMLAEGFSPGQRTRSYLFRDQIRGRVKARDGARLASVMNAGAIPELGDYRVVTDGERSYVGTVNEDFAIESMAGDIFLLGNTSWQIVNVRGTEVVVRDAHGAPATIPFWLGEAPSRTVELSSAVSALRAEVGAHLMLDHIEGDPLFALDQLLAIKALDPDAYRPAREFLRETVTGNDWAALQAVHYVAVEKVALGLIPSKERVVFERFFDESGGMQLVIHAPFGMRINRGFGLALRKRFCRTFDFELQASADNDGIVLSLGPNQSFPLESLFKMVTSANVKDLLVQAILQAPLFQVRFRWNANRSLAVLRMKSGQRVAPALQRFRADDLLTAIFPQQTQCFEHRTGDLELPDHPLVHQTMKDCLEEAIDIDGLIAMLQRVETGEIEFLARDVKEPSPFAYQLLNANPYAFLDDAPLEERRARAVQQRRSFALRDLSDLARLDPKAIDEVRKSAWPTARNADELHDVLMRTGLMPAATGLAQPSWQQAFEVLVAKGRATVGRLPAGPFALRSFWIAAENLPLTRAAQPEFVYQPAVTLPPSLERHWESEDAIKSLLHATLETHGVMDAQELADYLALPPGTVKAALPALEATGAVLRGNFRGSQPQTIGAQTPVQWCERRLLMRIQRLTIDGLRRQIEPVRPEDFLSFLAEHQKALPSVQLEGVAGVQQVLAQLAGFDAAAGAWESEILPTRVKDYRPSMLDELMHQGHAAWARLSPPSRDVEEDGNVKLMQTGMDRATPLALFPREHVGWLIAPGRQANLEEALKAARPKAVQVFDVLAKGGAQFYAELTRRAGLIESELDDALGELARLGLIHADGFEALRPFVSRNKKQAQKARAGLSPRFAPQRSYALGGRWAVFPPPFCDEVAPEARITMWAKLLLARYGVVFRDLLTRESASPSWSEMVRTFRTMEIRGEIRGGRFVAGDFGEQFALPEAIQALRRHRDAGLGGDLSRWVVISPADPLNLTGIVTNGARIAASRQMLVVLSAGDVVATRDGVAIDFHKTLPSETEHAIERALRLGGAFRGRMPDAARG